MHTSKLARRVVAPSLIALSLALVTAALPPPGDALADSAPAAHRAKVEIVEAAAHKTNRAVFTVALVENGTPSEIAAQTGGAFYELRLSATAGKTGAPTLSLNAHGRATGGKSLLSLSTSASAPVGKRVVFGRVEHPDGTAFEVAVTID